jgi:hypothetical protein
MALLCHYYYGMCTVDKAKRVLAEAQNSLRELMEAGIRQHRYGEVAEIAGLAEGLSRLLVGSNGWVRDPAVHMAPARMTARAPEARNQSEPAQPSPARPKATSKDKAEYPRFERDGDRLVKVGWSKKHKDEYEHRAARETVIAVVRHIASRVKSGQVFDVEGLLPILDSAGGEVPAYQVYLTLSWLRSVGAVEKKGRDGQILRDGSIGSGGLDKLWQAVPVRTR